MAATMPARERRRRRFGALASGARVLLTGALFALMPLVASPESGLATQAEPEPGPLRGIHYVPSRPAPAIHAVDHNGRPFVSNRQPHPLQLVIFGYVSCLDVCPTNLRKMVRIQKDLGDEADQVQFVFVSVAPEQETPEVMRKYLLKYDGEVVGLTAKSPGGLDETYVQWGIVRRRVELEKPVAGRAYKYDHSAQMYLVRDGEIVVSYPYGTGVEVMVEDLRALLHDPSLGKRLPDVGSVTTVALPPGTFTRAAQDNPTIPAYLRLRKGTAIRWRNDDYMYHFIGDISLAPGSEALQRFDEAGTFYFGCTAVPSEVIRIAVLDDA